MAAGKGTGRTPQQGVKEYTVEEKASAIADLALGESVHATARKHGVSPATLRRWREQAGVQVIPPPGDPEKRDEVGALVMEYLREALLAGIAVARQAHDEAWRKEQSAAQLGVFLGVLFDKSAVILQALPGADGDGPDQVDTGPPRLAPPD